MDWNGLDGLERTFHDVRTPMIAQWVNKKELVASMLLQCNETRRCMLDTVIADTMPPIDSWPEHCIRLFLGSHVGFNGISVVKNDKSFQFTRYDFFCFLLGNGMQPAHVVDWCLAQPGYLRHDKSAIDVAGIITKHGKGELAHKQIWSLEKKMTVPCETPSFAFDECGQRIKVQELNEDGTAKLVNGEPIFTVEYMKPGCFYWKHAAARLTAASKMLPRKKDSDFEPPPKMTKQEGKKVVPPRLVPTPRGWESEAPQHFLTGAAASHGIVPPPSNGLVPPPPAHAPFKGKNTVRTARIPMLSDAPGDGYRSD